MTSAPMALAVIGIFGEVAIGISAWWRLLGEGIWIIGRKRIRLGIVWVVSKWHQLASRRLRTAWVAVVRHHARGIAVGSRLRNVTPALAGMARGRARPSRWGVWVVVLVF